MLGEWSGAIAAAVNFIVDAVVLEHGIENVKHIEHEHWSLGGAVVVRLKDGRGVVVRTTFERSEAGDVTWRVRKDEPK